MKHKHRSSSRPEKGPRINQQIRVPEVRAISQDKTFNEVLATSKALELARAHGLDLIEIAPQAKPPVCLLMELSKWKYEQKRAQKASNHKSHALKEVQLRPNIGDGDLEHKLKHMREFLLAQHPLKITLRFKGRELAHTDLGMDLVQRVVEELQDIGRHNGAPRLQGRAITVHINPQAQKA